MLAGPGTSHALIGDTPRKLVERYGNAETAGAMLIFQLGNLALSVYFDPVTGQSAMEVYGHVADDQDGGVRKPLSQDQIKALLERQSGGVGWRRWRSGTGKMSWMRNDGKVTARYNPNDNVLVFMVNSIQQRN